MRGDLYSQESSACRCRLLLDSARAKNAQLPRKVDLRQRREVSCETLERQFRLLFYGLNEMKVSPGIVSYVLIENPRKREKLCTISELGFTVERA